MFMSKIRKLQLIITLAISLIVTNTNGFSIRMIPIESPQLGIVPYHERHQFLINISLARVLNLRKDLTPNSIESKVFTVRSRFVTQIGLGEGAAFYSPYLELDTGSDLIWVQSDGCTTCFELSLGQNFQLKQSPSFRRINQYDPLCLNPTREYRSTCGFRIRYGVAPPYRSVKGFVRRDSLHVTNSDTGNSDVYPGVAFGCMIDAENYNYGPQNRIAGVFGMSAGPRSFLSQLHAQTKGRFSYCLAISDDPPAESTLYFGDSAQISGDATRQVQTISMNVANLYHLYVNGISVDGHRLPIDLSFFELDQRNSKGFFIDSGAPITILAKSAFDPLEKAVQNYFKVHYGWERGPPAKAGLTLCYEEDPDFVAPSVVFHFRNNAHPAGDIDMVLGKDNLFLELADNEGFCLAIKPVQDPGPCVFGAFQQTNFKIFYDVQNSRLSFVPQNCRENVA